MTKTRNAFVGIDVAFAKKKRLPVCICVVEGGRLTPLSVRGLDILPPQGKGNAKAICAREILAFAMETRDYLAALAARENLKIRRIAVDAPMNFKPDGDSHRACERALARIGISCFTTPSRQAFRSIVALVQAHIDEQKPVSRIPYANKLWMLVGFALFRVLSKSHECIEVYPQAIAKALGVAGVHKSKDEGYKAQLKEMAERTGWTADALSKTLLQSCFGSRHDRLDAYMSAWVASLNVGERVALGKPSGDTIWVPKQLEAKP